MNLNEMRINPFKEIGSGWALVTAGTKNGANMMTVSWGAVGVMWGKNVVFVFVRGSRYTKEFLDSCDTFSLSFFDENTNPPSRCAARKAGAILINGQPQGSPPAKKTAQYIPKKQNAPSSAKNSPPFP